MPLFGPSKKQKIAETLKAQAELHFRNGEHQKAADAYTELIRQGSYGNLPFFLRAQCHARLLEYQKAIDDWTRAISALPVGDQTDLVVALKGRADAYLEIQEFRNALLDVNSAMLVSINLDPDPEAFFIRGRAYQYLDDHQNAIDDFTQLIRLQPGRHQPFGLRGTQYSHIKEWGKAIDDFTQVIRLQPNDGAAFGRRGDAYCAISEHQKAIDDFTQGIRIFAEDSNTLSRLFYRRAHAYQKLENHLKATDDFTEAIRLQYDSADAFYARGYSYGVLGDYKKALGDFTETLRLQPDNPDAYENREWAYKQVKLFDEIAKDETTVDEINRLKAPIQNKQDIAEQPDYY